MKLARDVFSAYVRARLTPDADPATALSAVHATDLYLACACALGDPAAVEAFEREILPHVRPVLTRLRVSRALYDEALQTLRVQLLVGGGGAAPRVLDYQGRGAFARWVQVAVVRVVLSLRRRRKTHGDLEGTSGLDAHAAGYDLEIELLKARAGADFDASFRSAVALLAPRERSLLWTHFVEGESLEQLARRHHVHRATVARWLSAARERLLVETRRRLRSRLGLDQRAVESLLAFVRSRMDVSLSALMGAGRRHR